MLQIEFGKTWGFLRELASVWLMKVIVRSSFKFRSVFSPFDRAKGLQPIETRLRIVAYKEENACCNAMKKLKLKYI
jgi:hypothetical protein